MLPILHGDHYENFPVASRLVPARSAARGRRHLPVRTKRRRSRRRGRRARPVPGSRRSRCYTRALEAIERGETPPLAPVPRARRRHPHAPACRWRRSTISLRRSARTSRRRRYATFDDVRRLLHALGESGGAADARAVRRANAGEPARERRDLHRAAARQLLAGRRDRLGRRAASTCRIEDLQRFGVSETQIADGPRATPRWRALMAFADRARARPARRRPAAAARAAMAAASGDRRRHRRRPAHPRAASTRVGGDVFRRRPVLGPCDWIAVALRTLVPRARGAHRAAHDARRVLPAEDRAKRLELLLQLPVPAAAATARDHGAVRVLPRSGRRRRRGARAGRRARRSSRGGGARSQAVFDGTPQHPVAQALVPVVREYRLPAEQLQTVIDGMAMDLEQSRYLDFAALEAYCHRVAGVVGLMSAEIFGATRCRDARLRPRPRHRVPAHEHHPRRRRGCERAAASTCRRTSSRASA